MLCSQASCLHIRQFCQSCKCTAAKYAFPTAVGNHSVFASHHDKGQCASQPMLVSSPPIRPQLRPIPKLQRTPAILAAAAPRLPAASPPPTPPPSTTRHSPPAPAP